MKMNPLQRQNAFSYGWFPMKTAQRQPSNSLLNNFHTWLSCLFCCNFCCSSRCCISAFCCISFFLSSSCCCCWSRNRACCCCCRNSFILFCSSFCFCCSICWRWCSCFRRASCCSCFLLRSSSCFLLASSCCFLGRWILRAYCQLQRKKRFKAPCTSFKLPADVNKLSPSDTSHANYLLFSCLICDCSWCSQSSKMFCK